MTSKSCKFKILERGFEKTIVLIPGWAADYRIFSSLDLNYNYILPDRFNPFDFSDRLSYLLGKESIDRISLFGWSLGGFLAVEFALRNPERVDELILLGIRKGFDHEALEEVRQKILANRKAYLYKFYLECFSDADREGLEWFRKYLLRDYLKEMKSEDLITGLDYFYKAKINAASLASIRRIRLFHGSEDRIAPFKEAEEIRNCLPEIRWVSMPGAGHILFLNHNFKEIFDCME